LKLVQSKEKKTDIFLSPAFGEFIHENVQKDSFNLALSPQFSRNPAYKAYLQQLHIYQKALYKLPLYVEKKCIFTNRSYEQSSSQATALYKSTIFKVGRLLDLCGGLGVDDWAFATAGCEVYSLDPDEELNEFAAFNFTQLDVSEQITRITISAEDFLKDNISLFDGIYCDADRRSSGKKAYDLTHTLPDIVALLPALFRISEMILIKASPMADISACCQQLQNVEQVIVVEWEGEVRELLFRLRLGYTGKYTIEAVDVDANGYVLHRVVSEHEKQLAVASHAIATHFYEPAPAIIKAGLVQQVATGNRLFKVSQNSAYLLGSDLQRDFWGRVFYIKKQMRFQTGDFTTYLKENNIVKANVSKRDFPLNVEQIRKKFKLKDGGSDYFFFTTNNSGDRVIYHCLK
jgi:hypothetical protein